MTRTLDVVIAGGGRVGFQTAELLDDRGHDVTIVERDAEVCTDVSEAWVATVIEGDATNPELLDQANVTDADVVAALTGETGLNLAVCLAATEMTDAVRTVARVDRAAGDAYTRFVDAVVYPERTGARAAANEIVGSDVRTLADAIGTLDIMQVRVFENAPAAGRTLADVRFPTGTLVISDGDGDRIARSDTTLEAGRHYVVAVEPNVVDEVLNLLQG